MALIECRLKQFNKQGEDKKPKRIIDIIQTDNIRQVLNYYYALNTLYGDQVKHEIIAHKKVDYTDFIDNAAHGDDLTQFSFFSVKCETVVLSETGTEKILSSTNIVRARNIDEALSCIPHEIRQNSEIVAIKKEKFASFINADELADTLQALKDYKAKDKTSSAAQ